MKNFDRLIEIVSDNLNISNKEAKEHIIEAISRTCVIEAIQDQVQFQINEENSDISLNEEIYKNA